MGFLNRLLNRDAEPRIRRPEVPAGTRVYAIGDVHGRSDLLHGVFTAIADDLAASPIGDALTVLIGDVIDRGSDSKGVVELLVSKDLPTRILTLCGNHEAMAKAFLQSASTCGDLWRRNGGTETLFSYGVDVQAFRAGKGFPDAAREFRDRLPSEHLEFLARLPTHFSIGDYYFCHAGVRPGVPLDRQRESDLLWIRDDFLSSGADFGKVVVHGHTPVPAVEVRGNRINIDTGAYISNVLTCLVLEGSQFRFLSRAAARAASLST